MHTTVDCSWRVHGISVETRQSKKERERERERERGREKEKRSRKREIGGDGKRKDAMESSEASGEKRLSFVLQRGSEGGWSSVTGRDRR